MEDKIISVFENKKSLSDIDIATIRNQGSATDTLVDIMFDLDLLEEESNRRYYPIFAAKVLCEIGSEEAIKAVVHVLAHLDPLDEAYDQVKDFLHNFCKNNIEKSIALRGLLKGEDKRRLSHAIGAQASECKDPMIFDMLIEDLRNKDTLSPSYLADFGDAKALKYMYEAFDSTSLPKRDEYMEGQLIIELEDSIKFLGGELSDSQRRKYRYVIKHRGEFRKIIDRFESDTGLSLIDMLTDSIMESRSSNLNKNPKIGRNDSCPCGSGKKYKKCCINNTFNEPIHI